MTIGIFYFYYLYLQSSFFWSSSYNRRTSHTPHKQFYRVSALAAGKQRCKQKPKCRSLFLISYQNLSLKICSAVRNHCTRRRRRGGWEGARQGPAEKHIVFSFWVRFHFVFLQFSFNIYASLIKLTPLNTGCRSSSASLPTPVCLSPSFCLLHFPLVYGHKMLCNTLKLMGKLNR